VYGGSGFCCCSRCSAVNARSGNEVRDERVARGPEIESELTALEDLISTTKLVRAGDAAVIALLDAMAEQVAKMPVG
jgi:hypothetical protein